MENEELTFPKKTFNTPHKTWHKAKNCVQRTQNKTDTSYNEQ